MLSRLVEDVLNPSDLDGQENSQDQSNSRKISRRGALAGGLVAAMSAVAGAASAQSRNPLHGAPGSRPPGTGGMGGGSQHGSLSNGSVTYSGGLSSGGVGTNSSVSVQRSWQDNDIKLLRRINYGPTPADLAEIKSIGYSAYLEKQLNPDAIDDSVCEAKVLDFAPTINLPYAQLKQEQFDWEVRQDWNDAVIIRSIYSKQQLKQRIAEFWNDHLYVDRWKVNGYLMHDYCRKIHSLSLTTFKELLVASANHAAMMLYLDNRANTASRINVNYARELLELHTVGVNGGYTEADIYQMADIFTGWGILNDNGVIQDEFAFHPEWNTPGTFTVMGRTFNQSGKAKGDAVLDWLSNHPKTIAFVGNKMARFFLGRDASPALMSRISNAWGSSGNIKAVLREILAVGEISTSVPKFKRPNHLIYSSVRQLGSNLISIWGLWNEHFIPMNMEPHLWNQPDGYPDRVDFWAGGMVRRIRFVQEVNSHWGLLPLLDVTAMRSMDDAAKVTEINARMFLGELPVSDQVWIRRYLKGKSGDVSIRAAFAIAMAGPSYQWY